MSIINTKETKTNDYDAEMANLNTKMKEHESAVQKINWIFKKTDEWMKEGR